MMARIVPQHFGPNKLASKSNIGNNKMIFLTFQKVLLEYAIRIPYMRMGKLLLLLYLITIRN